MGLAATLLLTCAAAMLYAALALDEVGGPSGAIIGLVLTIYAAALYAHTRES